MKRLVMPKRPSIKKPNVPRKPKKPSESIEVMAVDIDWLYDCIYDNSGELVPPDDKYDVEGGYNIENEMLKFREQAIDFMKDLANLGFAKNGISFKVGEHGCGYIHFPNPKYKEDLTKYNEKLSLWEEKTKDNRAKLKKYEAVIKEYKIQVHKWEIEKAHQEIAKLKNS